MKIRTTIELTAAIDSDLAWRKKELRYLASRVGKAESDAQLSYLRAAVALLYAHWEGFVVSAIRAYIEFVSNRRICFENLKPELRVAVLRNTFRELESAPGNAGRVRLFREYAACIGKVQKIKVESVVKADSNLNAERFLGLLALAGLDESRFRSASAFLDEALLAKRNSVCHGERVAVDTKGYLSTEMRVVSLMELAKNEILNAAVQGTFEINRHPSAIT